MSRMDWVDKLVRAVTITDPDGKIFSFNKKAADVFAAS